MSGLDHVVVDERAILKNLAIVRSRPVVENFGDETPVLALLLCFNDEMSAFELSRDEIASTFAC